MGAGFHEGWQLWNRPPAATHSPGINPHSSMAAAQRGARECAHRIKASSKIMNGTDIQSCSLRNSSIPIWDWYLKFLMELCASAGHSFYSLKITYTHKHKEREREREIAPSTFPKHFLSSRSFAILSLLLLHSGKIISQYQMHQKHRINLALLHTTLPFYWKGNIGLPFPTW